MTLQSRHYVENGAVFCRCGSDTYICQVCAKVFCAREFEPKWRPDITGTKSAGNVCPFCMLATKDGKEVKPRVHKTRVASDTKSVFLKKYKEFNASWLQKMLSFGFPGVYKASANGIRSDSEGYDFLFYFAYRKANNKWESDIVVEVVNINFPNDDHKFFWITFGRATGRDTTMNDFKDGLLKYIETLGSPVSKEDIKEAKENAYRRFGHYRRY